MPFFFRIRSEVLIKIKLSIETIIFFIARKEVIAANDDDLS